MGYLPEKQKPKAYTKKPVTIAAYIFDGSEESANWIVRWTKDSKTPAVWFYDQSVEENRLAIRTLEGPHTVSVGDYVIKGVAGEFYPCKPEIFHASYVEAQPDDFLGRLKIEHEELRQRINKLAAFIGTAPYGTLPIRQQNLLGHQINAMREYRDVLSDRLKDLEKTASREAVELADISDEPGEELGDGVRMTGPDHSNDAPEFNR